MNRWLSASYYVGLAPLTRLRRSPFSDPLLQHHYTQAMAALFLLLILFLADCAVESAVCLGLILFPGSGDSFAARFGFLIPYWDKATLLFFVALATLWLAFLGLALVGSSRPMPLLSRVSRWPVTAHVSLIANSLILAAIPFVFIFACWAGSMTRGNCDGAKVYFLYDEGIAVPRWGYALGLSRIALQAQHNWGKGSTVLDHLNQTTLRTTLANGRVLILATHGEDGYASTYFAPEVLGVWPAEIGTTDAAGNLHFLRMALRTTDRKWRTSEDIAVNSRLQLAYIFACHAGAKAAQWQQHLAPARVLTYNRFSTVL